MADMTVDEAVYNLEGMMVWFEDADVDSVPFNKDDALALRVVLDELKALQECSTCSCKPGEWAQK